MLGRIPFWLSRDGFVDMMREGLGDAEARFFSPLSGIVRELAEYKNHDLGPTEFWAEVDRFRQLNRADQRAFFQFRLVCTGLSSSLEPLANALRRVRDTMPFYDGSAPIQDVTYAAFTEIVVKHDKDAAVANFLFEKVVIDSTPPKTVDQGFERFRGELETYFVEFQDLGSRTARAAYDALVALIANRLARPVTRAELEGAIWGGPPERPGPQPLRVVTQVEPSGLSIWEYPAEIRFDWSRFSGQNDRSYPPSDEWNDGIVAPLIRTKGWIISSDRHRRVGLRGQRRLSAALALGAVFNAVSGFAIDLHLGGDQIWSTDDHATSDTPELQWRVERYGPATATALAVVVGILRNPLESVRHYLDASRWQFPILSFHAERPLESAKHINLAVRRAKELITDAVAGAEAKTVHLFLAVPAPFALFLGHRLNTVGRVQCYEWVNGSVYTPTCLLAQS